MIGALVAVVVTLASVVAYLFKRYERRDDKRERAIVEERKAMDAERASWANERQKWNTEREALRADYEERCAELSAKYAEALREDHRSAVEHEDEVRADFAAIMDRVAQEAGKSSTALVDMLQKFYERFVGPRPRY